MCTGGPSGLAVGVFDFRGVGSRPGSQEQVEACSQADQQSQRSRALGQPSSQVWRRAELRLARRSMEAAPGVGAPDVGTESSQDCLHVLLGPAGPGLLQVPLSEMESGSESRTGQNLRRGVGGHGEQWD